MKFSETFTFIHLFRLKGSLTSGTKLRIKIRELLQQIHEVQLAWMINAGDSVSDNKGEPGKEYLISHE